MILTMLESMRWYGPSDSVLLPYIHQSGAAGVYTSLHQISCGDVWSREAIREQKQLIEKAGLSWIAVESVPVHEDIKTRTRDYQRYIENYKQTLKNLGAEGLELVIYNFMPVFDWIRTDMAYRLGDGSECLSYDPVHFAAFEIYLLKCKGAENRYTQEQLSAAKDFFESLDDDKRKAFEQTLIDVFTGFKKGVSVDDIRTMLATYSNIDRQKLKDHLRLFLQEVIPVAEASGIRMAVHPDDPPFAIMGLPRIVSCEEDIVDLLDMVESPSNGLCFCTGAFSPRAGNDLPYMVKRFGPRIYCAHLHSTQRNDDGGFYGASHLEGPVDMYLVVRALLEEMHQRRSAGRADWQIPFRPDHGHTMLDDIEMNRANIPGYSAIGRLSVLAELRGLQLGLARTLKL